MFQGGYLTIARVRGALIRIHYSAPIGAVCFGRFEIVPGFWLAFIAMVLIHELGHAAMVLACRARVIACDVTGLGGTCTYDGDDVTDIQDALIAWGGVLAQALVYGIAQIVVTLAPPSTPFMMDVAHACLSANVWIAVINLMPVRPLDGAYAWRLFPLLLAAHRRRRAVAKATAARATLAKVTAHDELTRLEEYDDDAPAPEVDEAVNRIVRDAGRKR